MAQISKGAAFLQPNATEGSRVGWKVTARRCGRFDFKRCVISQILGILTLACGAPSALALGPPAPELLQQFQKELVEITPGTAGFPASKSLPDKFAMQKYEVTQSLYEAIMGNNPSRWRGPRNAVEMVSFSDATQFCQKLTEHLRVGMHIAADQEVRLPTGEELEYCCRAGSEDAYSFGNDVKLLGDYAWYKENAAGNDPPVGAKKPNRWGLYDMHGYVWEWCQETERNVSIRGGAWTSPAEKCRCEVSQSVEPTIERDDIGFRCVVVTIQAVR